MRSWSWKVWKASINLLRAVDEKWLIDEVYYGFESDVDKWYSDYI